MSLCLECAGQRGWRVHVRGPGVDWLGAFDCSAGEEADAEFWTGNKDQGLGLGSDFLEVGLPKGLHVRSLLVPVAIQRWWGRKEVTRGISYQVQHQGEVCLQVLGEYHPPEDVFEEWSKADVDVLAPTQLNEGLIEAVSILQPRLILLPGEREPALRLAEKLKEACPWVETLFPSPGETLFLGREGKKLLWNRDVGSHLQPTA